MATYLEIYDLKNHNDLMNKMVVAVVKKSQVLLDGATPTTDEVAWANKVLSSPRAMAEKIFMYVLAANSSATVSQITGATDAAIQTKVDAAAAALIAGGAVS